MKLRWAEPIATRIGSSLDRALAATWRYRVTGYDYVRALRESRRPFVFVLWHSRILPLLYRHRDENVVMLISRHRDGGYLADLGERWGYRSVRGSTRRGGEVGLLGVVRALEGGAEVAITPDGPRGPAERVQPGAIAAAQHAGVPIVAVGARVASARFFTGRSGVRGRRPTGAGGPASGRCHCRQSRSEIWPSAGRGRRRSRHGRRRSSPAAG